MSKGKSREKLDAYSPEELLAIGYGRFLDKVAKKLGDKDGHFDDTPERVVRALAEMCSGVDQDPGKVLSTAFTEARYDQMIWVKEIPFVSYCRHHLLPFFGMVHFAYLPAKRVVGLSKIARLVDILARRPQLQENLAEDIVSIFDEQVKPLGCGVVIEARHSCMAARGVRKDAVTRTVALRREFKKPHVKTEFLEGIK